MNLLEILATLPLRRRAAAEEILWSHPEAVLAFEESFARGGRAEVEKAVDALLSEEERSAAKSN